MVAVVSIPTVHLRNVEWSAAIALDRFSVNENKKKTGGHVCQASCGEQLSSAGLPRPMATERAFDAARIDVDLPALRPSLDRADADRRVPDHLRVQGLRRNAQAIARRLLR